MRHVAQVADGSAHVLVIAVGPNSTWGKTMALVGVPAVSHRSVLDGGVLRRLAVLRGQRCSFTRVCGGGGGQRSWADTARRPPGAAGAQQRVPRSLLHRSTELAWADLCSSMPAAAASLTTQCVLLGPNGPRSRR